MDADGLCTQLTKSLPKKGKQDFCVDPKAFVEAGWVIHDHELEVSGDCCRPRHKSADYTHPTLSQLKIPCCGLLKHRNRLSRS